ncbi:MAG: DUF1611 domain-containing protein [Isosphaeraceae bacterium]
MRKPYLLFLGDAADGLAAKTAQGLADWRSEWCIGQHRLVHCRADTGLPDLTIEEAATRGAGTMVIGLANSGGALSESWIPSILDALEHGMDVASGLHMRLSECPEVATTARGLRRTLHDVRHTDQRFPTGCGTKRRGRRVLTVGSDCSVGKMYTALALEKELRRRGLDADFRATGQTGILISGNGVAVDALAADFVAGAAEWLSPDNDPDHWDVIEGQGSLAHPAFAGVTLGLLHGSQPDALVMCHEPSRTHSRGLPHHPLLDLDELALLNLRCAKLTNPKCIMAGISINTCKLSHSEALRLIESTEERYSLGCTDPRRFGVGNIVDELLRQDSR